MNSGKGYQLAFYMNQTEFQKDVSALTNRIQFLVVINIILCIMLILFSIMFNYKSIWEVIAKIRRYDQSPNKDDNEMEYILKAFTGQIDEKNKLKLKVYEQHIMIYDSLIEKLLLGQSVSDNDIGMLKNEKLYCFVVNINSKDATDIDTIISQNKIDGEIYAIEMYSDNYLTFVCFCDNPSFPTRNRILQKIYTLLDSEKIDMGISSLYYRKEQLCLAYLESSKNLSNNEKKIIKGDHSSDLADNSGGVFKASNTIARLTNALKTGDDYAVKYAREAFRKINDASATAALATQRYQCFQVLELYRRIAEELDIKMDVVHLSYILNMSSIDVISNEFCKMINLLCHRRQKAILEKEDITYVKLMSFINSNYTNPLFGLDTIADHYGMSIYTASRMVKNMIGINLRKYINNKRIEYAKDLLLATNQSISEIAERVGFSSASYFIRVFKQNVNNTTPYSFRNHKALSDR